MRPNFRPGEQLDRLLHHAANAVFFTSEFGLPCVALPLGPVSGHVVPLHAPAFRDWLLRNFYHECETIPSPYALRHAMRAFEAAARVGPEPRHTIHHRIGFTGEAAQPDSITLQLADDPAAAVAITPDGWSYTAESATHFLASAAALPLPEPSGQAHLPAVSALRSLLNLPRADFDRALAWLLSAFRPAGPYPILVIEGPPNSGKSTAARMLRSLIDPSRAPLEPLCPVHHLPALAGCNWVLAFDHARRLSPQHAAALAALSSGDGVGASLNLHERIARTLARPVLLIQNEGTPLPETIAPRTVVVRTRALPEQRTELELWDEFEKIRPAVLAALCTATARAMAGMRHIRLTAVTRLADAVAWTAAGAPALGIPPDALCSEPPSALPAEVAVITLLERNQGRWTGSAASLHQLLVQRNTTGIPATPKGLVQWLAKLPSVRVTSTKGARGRRTLELQLIRQLVAQDQRPARPLRAARPHRMHRISAAWMEQCQNTTQSDRVNSS